MNKNSDNEGSVENGKRKTFSESEKRSGNGSSSTSTKRVKGERESGREREKEKKSETPRDPRKARRDREKERESNRSTTSGKKHPTLRPTASHPQSETELREELDYLRNSFGELEELMEEQAEEGEKKGKELMNQIHVVSS